MEANRVTFILLFSLPLLSTSFRLSDGEKRNIVSNEFLHKKIGRVLQLSDFELGKPNELESNKDSNSI